ncbi:MAG: hypothetical protein COW65_09525, partial [Cytophagales bacterium CG18_big_fil_WC_8_21_14_2_50_42_9]
QVRNSSGTVLKTVDVPITGGWQTWTTVSASVALNSGSQTIQIYVTKNGWNFNWFEISNATTSQQSARSQFTEDLSLQKNISASNVTWSVYPNPTPDKVEVNIGSQVEGEVIIDLMDAAGKTINRLKIQKSSDVITESLSLDNLNKGMYFIHLSAKGVKEVKKIIKQ